MVIYLIRNSQYNEDFNLSGYAVDDNGIKLLATNYVKEYFDPDIVSAEISADKKEITVIGKTEFQITFHISAIIPVTQL